MLVSIDPGNDTGWALWALRGLVACGLGDPRSCPAHRTATSHDHDLVDVVWIESQVIYPRSPVPPNDIVRLAQGAGRWAGIYETLGVEVRWVEPARWKGQTPKDIHHARIWADLRPEEQEIVRLAGKGMPPSKRHNMLDALGIGIWARRGVR